MRHSSVGFALGLLLTASAPVCAATTQKHSGVLVAADPTHQTMTIEEMGGVARPEHFTGPPRLSAVLDREDCRG